LHGHHVCVMEGSIKLALVALCSIKVCYLVHVLQGGGGGGHKRQVVGCEDDVSPPSVVK
jgi:hypothetical protein